ncbi:MAG: hypothetical protein GXP40_09205 [Chloroflexi bacterium]|nr:hypothetical protein [Chloroflexota bacterium]
MHDEDCGCIFPRNPPALQRNAIGAVAGKRFISQPIVGRRIQDRLPGLVNDAVGGKITNAVDGNGKRNDDDQDCGHGKLLVI